MTPRGRWRQGAGQGLRVPGRHPPDDTAGRGRVPGGAGLVAGCGSCPAGRATTGWRRRTGRGSGSTCGRRWPRGRSPTSELAAALGRSSRYRHLGTIVAEGNDTLLKPLTWQGDMGLGPVRDGEATFLRLDSVPGLGRHPRPRRGRADGGRGVRPHPRPGDPGTGARLVRQGARREAEGHHPLAGPARRPARARSTIDGDRVLVLREDLDDLRTTPASTAVRLLPGRDPWVMAPGTSDTRIVPPARRERRQPLGQPGALAWRRGRHLAGCAASAWRSPGSRSPAGCHAPPSTGRLRPWPGCWTVRSTRW